MLDFILSFFFDPTSDSDCLKTEAGDGNDYIA